MACADDGVYLVVALVDTHSFHPPVDVASAVLARGRTCSPTARMTADKPWIRERSARQSQTRRQEKTAVSSSDGLRYVSGERAHR